MPYKILFSLTILLGNSGLIAQSLHGTWTGKIARKGKIYNYSLQIKQDLRGISKTDGGYCYGVARADDVKISFDQSTGKLSVIEHRIGRSTNQDMKCTKMKFGSKTMELHPIVGADQSYVILQGIFSGWGKGIGYVYITKTITPTEAKQWASLSQHHAYSEDQSLRSGELVFDSDFNRSSLKISQNEASFKAKGGQLTAKPSQKKGAIHQPLGIEMPMNFDLETEIRIPGFPHSASFFWGIRQPGPRGSGYQVAISNTHLTIRKYVNGEAQAPSFAQDFPALLAIGEPNKVRIYKILNEVRYFLNGKHIHTTQVALDTPPLVSYTMAKPGIKVAELTLSSLDAFGPDMNIDQITYQDEEGNDNLVATIPGKLLVTVRNSGQLEAPPIQLGMSTGARGKELAIESLTMTTERIPAGQSQTILFEITPSHQLSTGDKSFTLSIGNAGAILDSKQSNIPAQSFYLTTQFSLPKAGPRQQAIGYFYGIPEVDIKQAKALLESQIQQGDQLAAMWKSIFLLLGVNGYAKDESQALSIARKSYSGVIEAARTGQAEGMHLLFYAYNMDLSRYVSPDFQMSLLQEAAHIGYPPANFDRALMLYDQEAYSQAHQQLEKAFQMGIARASILQGRIHERGLINNLPSFDKAYSYYKRAADKGDGDAMFALAQLYRNDKITRPDIQQALVWAEKAAELENTAAMVFIADAHLNGKSGMVRDSRLAIDWYKKAIDAGSVEAKMALGIIYMDGTLGFSDLLLGKRLIREAALDGNPYAMAKLSQIELKRHETLALFWDAMARENGLGEKKTIGKYSYMSDFFKHADFSPNIYDVTTYIGGQNMGTRREVDYFGGFFGGLLTGAIGMFAEKYKQKQEIINEISLLEANQHSGVYAAVVSSHVPSEIQVSANQLIRLQCFGEVSFYNAEFHDSRRPDEGSRSPNDPRFCDYIEHGKMMFRVGNGPWRPTGMGGTFSVDAAGNLELAVNDKAVRNNAGYFYALIEVIE